MRRGPGDVRVSTSGYWLQNDPLFDARLEYVGNLDGDPATVQKDLTFQLDVIGLRRRRAAEIVYYAPMSVAVLLWHTALSLREAPSHEFARLVVAATALGHAATEISVMNQVKPALIAAGLSAHYHDFAVDATQNGDAALEILRERYARGELTRNEFLRRLADLTE